MFVRRIFEMALHLCLCYLCLKVSEPWDFQDQTYWSFSAWNSLFCRLSWSLWDSSTSREQTIAGRKWKVKIVDPLERKHYEKTLSLQCPGKSLTHFFFGGGAHCLYLGSFFDIKALLTVESPGRSACSTSTRQWKTTTSLWFFPERDLPSPCFENSVGEMKFNWRSFSVCFPVSILLKAYIHFCLIIYFMFFPRSRK